MRAEDRKVVPNQSHAFGRRFGIFLVIAVFVCLNDLSAQNYDFGAWAGASVNKEIIDDLKLDLNAQFRTNNNSTRIATGLVNVSLGYKLNKHVSFGAAYRFSQKNDYRTSWEPRHRWQIAMVLKKKMKPFTFQYKTRYQIGFRNVNEGWYDSQSYWRNKLVAKIDLDKKFEPYLGAELFYLLNYNQGLDQYRFVAGLNWDLPKKMELKTGYLFQQEIRMAAPITEHVIQVGFSKKL